MFSTFFRFLIMTSHCRCSPVSVVSFSGFFSCHFLFPSSSLFLYHFAISRHVRTVENCFHVCRFLAFRWLNPRMFFSIFHFSRCVPVSHWCQKRTSLPERRTNPDLHTDDVSTTCCAQIWSDMVSSGQELWFPWFSCLVEGFRDSVEDKVWMRPNRGTC